MTSRRDVADAPPAGAPTTVQERLAYDRTYLANERTFAAWLRTGLSIAAGGIAVAHLVPEPSRGSLQALTLGAAFVVLGVSVMAYGAHQAAAMAKRLAREGHAESLGSPRPLYFVTTLVSVLLVAVLFFLWTHRGPPARGSPSRADIPPASADGTRPNHIPPGP